MFRNYLAAALRNVLRNRAVTLINITGLAIGFAAALMIALYVRYEYSYETFIPGYERIYRLSVQMPTPTGGVESYDMSHLQAARWLELDFPEIEHTARIDAEWLNLTAGSVEYKDQTYSADPDFFRLFPIPAVAGDLSRALDSPDGVAISRTIARKYFGNDHPIGKLMEVERSDARSHTVLHVAAVFEDLPGNSHLNFRIVVSSRANSSLKRLDSRSAEDQQRSFIHTYFRLRPGADIARIESQLPDFLGRHLPKGEAGGIKLTILPISQIHLAPEAKFSMKPRGNPQALRGLSFVGVIIALIAVMNYVNLTTARSTQRSVEVGVRKLSGARRRDLWLQFSAESLLQVVFAMLIAVSLVELALPWFRSLLDAHNEIYAAPTIRFDYWRDPSLAAAIAAATLLDGIVAAAYPALVLANMRPAAVFKGTLVGSSGASLRRIIVVLQFAMLIGLIFATTLVHRQTDFALRSAARIDTDLVALYWLWTEPEHTGRPAPAFVNELPKIPGVRAVTAANGLPINVADQRWMFNLPGKLPLLIHQGIIDYNFFDFYRIPLLAGRKLARDRATDRMDPADRTRAFAVIINETAVKALGFSSPEAALGQTLIPGAWPADYPGPSAVSIVGIAADFPIDSVRHPIEPTLFFVLEEALGTISVRVAGDDVPGTMERVDRAWKKFGQPRAQLGALVESWYRDLYADIVMQRTTLTLFSGCAIFLAALGLLGLSTYTMQRRTREIGIRKAMGANTGDVMRLLLWSFSKPVLWASLVAWPVTGWLMYRWLEGFVYRVPLGWWWLPASTAIALLISLLTVSFHSFVAARARPVASLRYE
jgi:putative ABC transport system permease protein